MTQVVPQAFQPNMTSSEVYDAVNSLAIDYLKFATLTNYYHRLFGVRTGGKEGTDGSRDDFIVNNCLREAVWTRLYSIQSQTEATIGYNLSPRYHTETQTLIRGFRVKTRFPGVEAVGVQSEVVPTTDEIDDTSVPLSPFVQINAPVIEDSGRLIVKLDRRVIFNPSEALLRSSVDNGVIETLSPGVAGFPKIHTDGDWLVVINSREHQLDPGETINVQSRKYVYVDVDPFSESDTIGRVHPVYTGTHQKIPLARPVERTADNKDRYWFYIYTMVDPDFFSETVDLLNGEFYKLVSTIDFRRFVEVPSYIRADDLSPVPCHNCDGRSWRLEANVVDAEKGIIDFTPVGVYTLVDGVEVYRERRHCTIPVGANLRVTYSYKTNPDLLPPRVKQDIPSLVRAILHRVAAELPVADCGCQTEGFIGEQQKAYQTSIALSDGSVISNLRYGSLHGQAVYAEVMNHVTLLNSHVI